MGLFMIFGVLYIFWFFVIYIPSSNRCDNQEGMAVHSVYPWGVKCTTYDEAFDHWNNITWEEKAEGYENRMWLETNYAERKGCKWVNGFKNPFSMPAEFKWIYSKRGTLFCPIGI